MPRRDESNDRRRHDDDSDGESDCYSTDSDCEHQMSTDMARELVRGTGVSERAVNDVYCRQSGVCRVTGLPFASDLYQAVLTPRRCSVPIADDNCMIVLQCIEKMRASTGMDWRTFVNFLQLVGKDAEL